jgi:hemoglobin
MELIIKELPVNERPHVPEPDNAIYDFLGEEGIRKIISDHYNLLVDSEIKSMFPPRGDELEQAKKRSSDFFIQRFGGPDYYNQTRGNPRLASRHRPFEIDQRGRIVWLDCYRTVLLKSKLPDHLLLSYWNYIHEFSNWMVNPKE